MKRKVLTGINALIALLLGILGLNGGCLLKYGPAIVAEYGVPHAMFEATGTITNEENEPIENIRVTLKDRYRPNRDYRSTMLDVYTADDGTYTVGPYGFFPVDSLDIIVTDTTGVYASDSVSVKVDYDRSKVKWGDNWDSGAGYVHQDFQLKKK